MGAVVVPGPERMEPKELKPPEFNEYWGKAKLPTIELEVSGIKIRIDDGVSPATIVAVISALKKTV
jgi:hypothetical protein